MNRSAPTTHSAKSDATGIGIQSRRGFTTVELFVVMGVISLLAAVLLPAVMQAREAARRNGCLSNLRELVAACHSHEAAHGRFPYTAKRFRWKRGERPHSSISPHAHLLPYLDQLPLYRTIEFDLYAADFPGSRPVCYKMGPGHQTTGRRVNETALTTTVPVFLCPSDRSQPAGNNYRACMGYGPGVFSPEIAGLQCREPGNGAGAFVIGRSMRPQDFEDGLSHTVFFSEALIGDGAPSQYTSWTDVFYYENGSLCTPEETRRACRRYAGDDALHDSYNGYTWLLGGWRHTWYNHVLTPNSAIPDCMAGGEIMVGGGHGAYGARSYHSGGVNVAFGDGSVRFISENISRRLWQALSTRAGGETVGQL